MLRLQTFIVEVLVLVECERALWCLLGLERIVVTDLQICDHVGIFVCDRA